MPVSSAKEIFEKQIPNRLSENPDLAGKINATYKFTVQGDGGGTWFVDLTQGSGVISESDADANCSITIGDKDLVDVVNGKLNAQMAFMSGKLKVAGDMALAMKLTQLFG